ncbi:hypothetical protein FALBO_14645 [Fusarium albosuccineum]|uniref:Uncharacterized protein n=1 Tax=Fusarium albosuccineum TaxID=1237068 RepID=A0A8H4KYH2_9HYPO|nr:hypothetical protein FALBO_14645 [Fusarium albosuccineum]
MPLIVATNGSIPDINSLASVNALSYDPLLLGKNRALADSFYHGCMGLHPQYHYAMQQAYQQSQQSNRNRRMGEQRSVCCFLGYGTDSMWPPFDPGHTHGALKAELNKHSGLAAQRWIELNRLVTGNEREIQDTIDKLANGKLKGDGILSLERYLARSWEMARDVYNSEHAREPEHMESDFYLDPKGTIALEHSSDLTNFAVDFLQDVPVPIRQGIYRHYPLYRHGANYKDMGETVNEIMRLDNTNFGEMKFPETETGNITFNKNVAGHLRNIRAKFLVPHINLTDLINPHNLLTFIHYRARLVPTEFVLIDNDLCYLGRHSKILSGACDPMCHVYFTPTHFGDLSPNLGLESYDEVHKHIDQDSWKQFREPWDVHERTGQAFGVTEAWLIMQSQSITYLFLSSLCKQMIEVAKCEEADPEALTKEEKEAIETDALAKIKEVKGRNGTEKWQDLASLRQYEPPPEKLNLERYQGALQSKRERAEDHILRLFDEPEYFVETILEQKDHHWQNLTFDYGDKRYYHIEGYTDPQKRHELYIDCIRSVLRRAVFDLYIWIIAETTLLEVDAWERNKPPYGTDPIICNASTRNTKTRPRPKWAGDDSYEVTEEHYVNAHIMIRYCALFFLLEFRNKAIHGASEEMRDHYCVTERENGNRDEMFDKGHYKSSRINLKLKRRKGDYEGENQTLNVGKLIENFISHKTSSMYVGVRKVTEQLQRCLDDPDDANTSKIFSNLVADTIDSLDLLAEIAEHLELHHRAAWAMLLNEDREDIFSAKLTMVSPDFMTLDSFPFEKSHVPKKRINRIFRLLDEMQGFNDEVTINHGQARGDLKRLGASLLRDLIWPTNATSKQRTLDVVLKRLEQHIGVRRDQYPFHEDEQPLDLDQEEKLPPSALDTRWRHLSQYWKDDNERRRNARRNKKKRDKKKAARGINPNAGFEDPVADEIKRRQILEARQKDELDRWHRRTQRRKDKLLQRHGKLKVPGSSAQDESASEKSTSPGLVPVDNDGDVEMTDDNTLQPQVQPQQPLPPVPPTRQLPQPALAPDNRPVGELNKRIWNTFKCIFGQTGEMTSWSDVVRAMNAIGYQDEGRGGSHGVFLRTENCRWPANQLPNGKNLQLSKYHGGSQANAPRGKTKDWGTRLALRGLTWGFLKQWYRQKM